MWFPISSWSRRLWPLAAGLALACGGPDPQEALEAVREAVRNGDMEGCYYGAKALSGEKSVQVEAFALASHCFQRMWFHVRWGEETGRDKEPWHTTEKQFMFEWLARFFENGDPEAARERALDLLVGFPTGFSQEFVGFARSDPRFEGWRLKGIEDNGRIEDFVARRD